MHALATDINPLLKTNTRMF